jgi:signal transduction histidine kinase
LSQLKTGDGEFHFIEMDVCSVVRRAADMLAGQAAERHVQIQQELPEPAVTVIDLQHLLRVMTSMLDNAIRFSPVGDCVSIRVETIAEEIQITVTNQGEAIAPEFLPHVFEEFTQTDLTHHTRGHGLSLAIARHVVQAHGGTITVESSPEAGTTFRVCLPQLCAGSSPPVSAPLQGAVTGEHGVVG